MGKFRKIATLLTCSFLFSGELLADSCPAFPLGVTLENQPDGDHFHSSVAVKNVPLEGDFEKDAIFEGQVKAKLALKNDQRVPRAKNNVLYGVNSALPCREGDTIFVSVSVSEKSARAAIKMKNLILDSLAERPVPLPSYGIR